MKRDRGWVALGLILAGVAMLPVLAQDSKPFLSGTLPREVVDAVNAQPRVYQYGGADAGHEFFFNGNTAQLNAFLASLTAVQDASFRVTLFTEPGRGQTLEDQKPFTYRWSMRIAEALPLAGVELTPTKRPTGGPTWEISVAISVAEGVELGRLEVPLVYHATIGGRLGNLVLWHNDRRQWLKEGEDVLKQKPTSEDLIKQLVNSLGKIEATPEPPAPEVEDPSKAPAKEVQPAPDQPQPKAPEAPKPEAPGVRPED